MDFFSSSDGLPPELARPTSSYANDAPRQTENHERKQQDGKQTTPVDDFLDVADLPRQKITLPVDCRPVTLLERFSKSLSGSMAYVLPFSQISGLALRKFR